MKMILHKKRRLMPIHIIDTAWAERSDGRVTKIYYLQVFMFNIRIWEREWRQ